MNLKESFRYHNYLDQMLDAVTMYLTNRNNVVKTETVQESCYLQLVRQGQTDFPILVTVAESRVVEKNFHEL